MISRDYLDHIPAGVVIVDASGRISVFNHAAALLTGLPAKRMLGRPWEQLVASRPWMGSSDTPQEVAGTPPGLPAETGFTEVTADKARGNPQSAPARLYLAKAPFADAEGRPAGKVITLVRLDRPLAPQAYSSADASPAEGIGHEVVTQDPLMERQLDLARRVAPRQATVLIQGESGTGKELVALYIHRCSSRPKEPYVAVNCAALPENLAESELFGHEKGAFTGAVKSRAGKFELAGRGTLVLDEISEMPLPLQAKLLRVLQERRIDPVGGEAPLEIDCRLVAISNRDLKTAVRKGKFRLDLYHRLNVIPLMIPALRHRPDDIPLLADFFLAKFCRRYERQRLSISPDARVHLNTYNWPGNVRELENAMERAVLIAEGDQLLPEDLILDDPLQSVSDPAAVRVGQTVREMERELIMKTLGAVSENRTKAAEMLGISIRTLRNKLNEYKAARAGGSAN